MAESPVAVCLMHMRGEPRTMQQAVRVQTTSSPRLPRFSQERADACRAAGIARERIVVDPGFGFGKTVDHNLVLLRRLEGIVALGYPVLAGLSRKSTIGALTGRALGRPHRRQRRRSARAVARGAAIVRVHDVRETVDALKVWEAIGNV